MLSFFKNVSKWFYAFAGTATALIAAVVVAIIFGIGANSNTPSVTRPSEGPETGIYYYDLEMGELQLSLNSGNLFSLTGPGYNTSGTYTVNGAEITLDFLKDEDGTATAVLEGDTLQLTLGDAVMTFLQKVNYAVSYNTNGGEAIQDAYVLNGKTAVKPADPVRDGFIFLGWYADEGLKTPFDFISTRISANTMIYARWIEKPVNQAEYTVSFELGYEAATIPDMTTIGGRIYNPTTPSREGYHFEGWFVSMYDDSEKLTFAYTEDLILTENTTFFAVWSVADTQKLPAPNVSVTATAVKWNAVAGASAYKLKITAPDGSVLYDKTLGSTTQNVGFEQLAAGDFLVEVSAVSNKTENNSDTAVRYFRNKALDRVSSFSVVDGMLIFNAVRNAERYLITVECGNPGHNHTQYDNGKSTNFNFANCTMQKGGIKFTVTAVAEGYAESVSKTFAYERALAPVTQVVYDKGEDAFIWDSVPFATYYTVTITAGGESHTYHKVMEYTFPLGNYSGEIAIEVTPVTEGYLSPESTKGSCTKTAPAIPLDLSANNTVLTWTANGAASYEVKINDKVFSVTEATFDLATASDLSLAVGEIYDISVRAIKDGESSAYCSPIKVGYYKLAPTLTYHNNTVYWSPVLGCSRFEVRVNGGSAMAVTGATSAKVTLTQTGLNVIEVRCTDLENAEWVSIQVNAYAITYMSRTALGEITEYLAPGDTMSLPRDMTQDGFTFGGWYNVPDGAEGNGKEYTDTVFNGNSSMVLFANWSANEYKIIFNVDPDVVTDMKNGSSQPVSFNKPFSLPVPNVSADESGIFKGWYTEAYGKGTRITNDEGVGLAPYTHTGDLNVYPFFDTASDVLAYELLPDGTYAVKGGPQVGSITKLRIPATYQGVAITEIRDNAFLGCTGLKSVSLPDTIRHIGVSAFDNCPKLEAFNVYVAKEGTYQVFYASAEGALLYFDEASGNNYLEIFPRAKTGTYTIPDSIDTIRPYAFNNASISKVVISTSVLQISENAFYHCGKLETIEFATNREKDVTVHPNAFYGLNKVTLLKLPARITPFDSQMTCLKSLSSLTTILVEEGSSVYTAVDNYLCDANPAGLSILYVPHTIKGEFKAPMGISGIGDNVFSGNHAITSVVIPPYINSIGAKAFSGCLQLSSFIVEGSRNSDLMIGTQAFANCSNLTTVEFSGGSKGRGMISVGDSAFSSCVSLSSFKVGAGVNVASIGNNVFKNNTSLSVIEIDNDAILSRIGHNAFEKCTALESFTVHKTTGFIGNHAFKDCNAMLTFIFGESDTPVSFGTSVFSGCSILKTIRLPKTLEAFDGSVFNDCISLESIEVDAANPHLQSRNGVLYTKGLTEVLFYPKNLDGDLSKLAWDTLQKLGAGVFKNNQRIETAVIGAGITEIGEGAFYGCTNLRTLSYDQANRHPLTIGNQAFYGCTKLTSASIPMTATAIGSEAFYNTAISSFKLPTALTTIGSKTFANTSLTSIEIPATVTSIGNGAFAGSAKLSSATFTAGSSPLVIGTTSAVAGEGVFEGTALTTLSLPRNLASIGSYAFANITTLKSASIARTALLTEIGAAAFLGCSNLTTINFTSTLSYIGDSAFENTKFSSISFPPSLTYLGTNAFKSVPLTQVTFANGPEGASLEIGEGAFANTRFPTIKLPSHMTALGLYNEPYNYYTVDAVFEGNTELHTIEVAEGNRIYSAQNGILYLSPVADQSTQLLLVYCPRAKTGIVTVPNTVYMIGAKAFYGTNLSSIRFQEFDKSDKEHYGQPLLTIGSFVSSSASASPYAAIGYTTTLQYIQFPSHLDTMNSFAVNGVNLPPADKIGPRPQANAIIQFNQDSAQGVSFKSQALSSNTAVKTLILPPVRDMGGNSFSGLINMTTLDLPQDSPMTSIAADGFSSNSLTSFTVPKNVVVIEDGAFRGSNLETIQWAGDKVQSLGANAFAHCDFVEFKIPDSVQFVGHGLFAYNTALKVIEFSMNMSSPVVSETENMLTNCPAIEEIRLPENHPTMKLMDGILYSKDGSTIYLCPSNKKTDGILQLPEGVVTIEVGAFNSFQGSQIKFPSTLKTIKFGAFRDCALEIVVFPASLEVIEDEAFFFNTRENKLSTVVFENNSRLKTIGTKAFYYSSITSMEIPTGVTSIGVRAFNGCVKLQSLSIPGTVKNISADTFSACASLSEVFLGEGIATIGDRAFQTCKALTTLQIPSSVTSIGMAAFSACESLESVYLPENSHLSKVGNIVFKNCYNLQTVIFGDRLSALGTNMFQGCTKLVEVRLPNALTQIPDSLFANCTDLTSVNIPTAVSTIGSSAFMNCAGLTEILIPNTITSIGQNAFAGCTNLAQVLFAEGCRLRTVADGVFDGDVKLALINLPSTVTSIGQSAFRNTAVSEIDFSNVTDIGAEAFAGCTRLKAAAFTGAIRSIAARAFADCTSLEIVNLPLGLHTIGELAFENCVSVKAFNIPATLTTITGNPFSNCTGVTKFTVDSANKSFIYSNGALYDKTGFTLIYYSAANQGDTFLIPDTVHEILNGAFAGSQLKTFEIPATCNITTIPANAFRGSKHLTSIIIPATVQVIGDHAFAGCTSLTSIHIPESVTHLGEAVFADCTSLATVTLAERNTDFAAIGASLFENCEKLTAVVPFRGFPLLTDRMYKNTGIVNALIPAWVTDLSAAGVFENCTSLQTVSLPENGQKNSIGDYFFANCTSLETVTLPAHISLIGTSKGHSFANCASLSTVTFQGPISIIGISGFENCAQLTTVNFAGGFPDHLGLSERTFANCALLTSFEMLNYCHRLPDEVFLNCASITGAFRATIKFVEMGNYALSGTGITDITFNSFELNVAEFGFSQMAENTVIRFETFTETQARNFFGAALEQSNATFEFAAENSSASAELTEKEVAGIDKLTSKIPELRDKGDILKEALLKFKAAGYLNNVLTAELSSHEIAFIQETLAGLNLTANQYNSLFGDFQKRLSAYKKLILESQPTVELTQEEIAGVEKLCATIRELTGCESTLKDALLSFKKEGYLTNVTSAEVTEAEMKMIQSTLDGLGLATDVTETLMKEFQNKLQAYKKVLMQG